MSQASVVKPWHIIAVLAVGLWAGYGAWHLSKQLPQHSEILKPVPSAPGPKRYVIWNKTALMRGTAGARTMNVQSFASMGATNIKQLELINGATFEAEPQALGKIQTLTALGDEWVVQEDQEHGILSGAAPVAAKCYQSNGPLVEVACGGSPNPSPTPSPTPEPNPNPVEPDKSWGRTRVHAKEAQALVDTSAVKVCVIDTGIDLQHPNKGNVIGSIGFAGAVQDGQGHGTHTAGTVAGTGGVGVSKAKLLICKGLSDSGSGSSSGLAQCLAWCGQQGAQIVSNSWGSPQPDGLINQAINSLTQRGVYVFVAAGNDSGPVNWPAKLAGSNPLVYAIAASDASDRITSFSSRGPEIRFISPGANITSSWPGGGTRALDGTSMATPHAAAVCAFGIARGRRPCIAAGESVAGYPWADALRSAQ